MHVQVVRCFEDDDIIHVAGKVDPLDDIDVINLELALADLVVIEKRVERLKKGEDLRRLRRGEGETLAGLLGDGGAGWEGLGG